MSTELDTRNEGLLRDSITEDRLEEGADFQDADAENPVSFESSNNKNGCGCLSGGIWQRQARATGP